MKITEVTMNLEYSTLTVRFESQSDVHEAYNLIASKVEQATKEDRDQQLVSLLRSDRKVEAIKLYRAWTGKPLKESKDYVDNLAAQHGI